MPDQSDIGKILLHLDFTPGGTITGELVRYKAPKIVEYLVKKLPIKQRIKIYKDNQIFISAGLKFGLEKGVSEVEAGDIAYWPVGDAFCIYRNPMKTYSNVNIIGKVVNGIDILPTIDRRAILEIRKI